MPQIDPFDAQATCDVLIVGAGTAGCLMARRAADAGHRVTLIEPCGGGPKGLDPSDLDRVRPNRWLNLLGSGDDWGLATESESHLAGRSLRWPRGRGLGGSSRINAMIWFEPTAWDWQQWRDLGGLRIDEEEIRSATSRLFDWVRPESPRWVSEASRAFLDTVANHQDDVRPMLYRRFNQRGRRWTSRQLLEGADVDVVDGQVDVVLFDDDRAIGVRLIDGSEIRCRDRVVLCAGAIASPGILMRSGIGPESVLRKNQISIRVESERVGRNLQDHLVMPVIFRVSQRHRFFETNSARDIARWQIMGTGPIASNLAECGGLLMGDRVQIHVTPTHYLTFPSGDAPAAMTIAVNVTQPNSRGSVAISSRDPEEPPIINANYLSDKSDLEGTIEAVRRVRSIAQSDPLSRFVCGEMLPGAKRATDQQIAKAIARYTQTLYHPVGTCAMGHQSDAVCDAEGFVRGVKSLQIMDASLFPTLPTGNPSVMLLLVAMMSPW